MGTEVSYISLFVLSRLYEMETVMGENEEEIISINQLWWERLFLVCVPACIIKQIVNVSQLCSACYAVARHDAEVRDK